MKTRPTSATTHTSGDWEEVGREWVGTGRQRTWRQIHDALNARLLERVDWLSRRSRTVLKTDLFDEMAAEGLLRGLNPAITRVGFDQSLTVARAARSRDPALAAFVGDVRCAAVRSGQVPTILSNSTLDHFEERGDLVHSIDQLFQILEPGGRLLITMDNQANPVLALRARLPFRLLHRLGVLPYPVGYSTGLKELEQLLTEAGFHIVNRRTIAHFPRILGVAGAAIIDRFGLRTLGEGLQRLVLACERFERLPTRALTGYFVAVVAERPLER